MGTAGARTGACPKAEQRNAEEEWEALTMFDKNKQMRAGGNLQGGRTENSNFHVEFPRSSEATKSVEKRWEGGRDEEELSLLATPYGDLWKNIRLDVEASSRGRTKCTSFGLGPKGRATRGSNTINMSTVIQFRR